MPDLPNTPLEQTAEPFWVTLGIDPISRQFLIIGFAKDRQTALSHASREPNATYVRMFDLMNIDADELYEWFRSCGLLPQECTDLIRDFGKSLGSMIRDIAAAEGWERSDA